MISTRGYVVLHEGDSAHSLLINWWIRGGICAMGSWWVGVDVNDPLQTLTNVDDRTLILSAERPLQLHPHEHSNSTDHNRDEAGVRVFIG